MLEVIKYLFKNRVVDSSKSTTEELILRTKTKNAILDICRKHLADSTDYVDIDFREDRLPYAIMVLGEEPLSNEYIFEQLSESTFRIRLMSI